MLVVALPKGQASDLLEEGYILVSLNGQFVTHFAVMEEYLDDHIGQCLLLVIERGGVEMKVTIQVQDLHSFSPNRFVRIGGAVLNNPVVLISPSVLYSCRRSLCYRIFWHVSSEWGRSWMDNCYCRYIRR